MKFLADENIFPKIISYLRNPGFDVKSVREIGLSQITDDKIVDIATKEKRSIITFDKHFGDILRYRP